MCFHFPQQQWNFKIPLYRIFHIDYFFGITKDEFSCPLLNRRRWLWTFSDFYTEKGNIFSQVSLSFKSSWTNFYRPLKENTDKIKILWYIRRGWSQKRNLQLSRAIFKANIRQKLNKNIWDSVIEKNATVCKKSRKHL